MMQSCKPYNIHGYCMELMKSTDTFTYTCCNALIYAVDFHAYCIAFMHTVQCLYVMYIANVCCLTIHACCTVLVYVDHCLCVQYIACVC